MRRQLVMALLFAAVLIGGCGGGDDDSSDATGDTSDTSASESPTTAGASAAAAPNACSILDAAAVSAAFGTQFAAGHASSATPLGKDGSSCEWNTVGESGFTLVVDGSNMQLPFTTGKSSGTAVTGVCDDAYLEGINLVAIKNGVYLHGSVNNVDDPEHAGLKKAISTACGKIG